MLPDCDHKFTLVALDGIEGQIRTATVECELCGMAQTVRTNRSDAQLNAEIEAQR